MEIKINLLNVNDGDAIIIELSKEAKTLVMVIDGGQPGYYATKMKPKLEAILKSHDKKAPDIVVCTHYDSDHIGGLIPLIEDYISDIQEVWVHETPDLLKGYIEEAINILNEKQKNVVNSKAFNFQNLFESREPDKKPLLDERANLLIESLPQLKKLLALIPPNKIKEVFHMQQPLSDWQEIIVLGPTKDYYDSLFPPTKSFEAFVIEESEEILPSEKAPFRLLELAGIKVCDTLKKDSETKLTATNKASIILAIDNGNGRYLFTGDAGIESFKSIPDWEKELKNIYFLKVPHHASNNNISKELIELMQPVYAYNTGDKYEDEAVLKCLADKARNKAVKTTKESDDLYFS